jgi:uncharacterized repeat protein (TIGR01451 family)
MVKALFFALILVLPFALAGTIQGTIFEDYNYGGGVGRAYNAASGMAVVTNGVTVELYNAATGVFIRSEATNAIGSYTFGDVSPATDLALTAGSYYVRVVNSTVRSTRTGGSACTTCIPVQTFRTSGLTGTVGTADTARVGGEKPEVADAGVGTATTVMSAAGVLTVGTTGQAQSMTAVAVATVTTNVTGINFGFNFSTVVNKNDLGQGSLRQFIINSNALTNTTPALAQAGSTTNTRGVTSALTSGKETSIFMLPDGNARSGLRLGLTNQLSSGVAVIQVGTILSTITDSDTIIDGGTQTFNITNTNTATLGTGGSVGTGSVRTVNQLNGPEVQLEPSAAVYNNGTTGITQGLIISGANTGIQNIAIKGFGFGTSATHSDILVNAVAGINTTTIRWNVIGTSATSFTLPTSPTVRYGVYSNEEGLQLLENLVGWVGMGGFEVFNVTSATLIEANEVRNSARANSRAENINLGSGGGAIVRGNLLVDSIGPGIDTVASTGSNVIEYNTVTNNGRNTIAQVDPQTPGIRLNGSNNTIRYNIIAQNAGAGVLVRFNVANIGNLITQNSIYANGTASVKQLGIDLTTAATQDDTGTSPFMTVNDNGDTDTGPNTLLNFPIFETITVSGGNLLLTGCAPALATIELFEADVSPGKSSTPGANTNAPRTLDYGEGETYLATVTEGTGDTDAGTGCTATDGNDQTGMARFAFSIPTPMGVVSGDRLTATATVSNNTSEFSPAPTVTTTDYGDAPASYGTPSHANTARTVYLGTVAPDGDLGHAYNGTVTATNASDDDTDDGTVTSGSADDDEDGVATFPTLNAFAGQPYTISVAATTTGTSYLVGYIDFNRDGVFGTGEKSTTVTVSATGSSSVVFTTPTGMTPGTTYARFRISSTQTEAESATGTATSGEVEDYSLTILATDYGDAPDTTANTATGNYKTLSSDGGPSHTIITGLAIGSSVDGDSGLLQNTNATLDDSTETDDEEGVSSFPDLLTTSATYTITVNVTNSTGGDAYLVAYLDRNRDGDFLDANEFPTAAVTVASSATNPRSFTVTIPAATSTAGMSYLRVRLSSTAPSGSIANFSVGALASGGEVEDYAVNIGVDYGDAPDTGTGTAAGNYQTLATDGGPSHQMMTGLSLGSSVDSDSGALQNTLATSDDTTNTGSADDEEGVPVFPALATTATSYSVSVNASNSTGVDSYLVGYIDFSRDGDFLDPGEKSATVTVVSSGTNPRSFTVNFTGLSGLTVGTTYARFRLSQTQLQAESSVGTSTSGEVEDYRISIGSDYGDAPDTGTGTGAGNYQTLLSDGGPSHAVLTGLAIGSAVDAEAGTFQSAAASLDDTNGIDDEEGIASFPTMTTTMTSYSLNVTATNSTGANAYLVGYIDFNRDGDFLDAGEKSATVTVASDTVTNPRTFTLAFTGLSGLVAGTNNVYARLRLSDTQTHAENSVGAFSSGGEIEDYRSSIVTPYSIVCTKVYASAFSGGRDQLYELNSATMTSVLTGAQIVGGLAISSNGSAYYDDGGFTNPPLYRHNGVGQTNTGMTLPNLLVGEAADNTGNVYYIDSTYNLVRAPFGGSGAATNLGALVFDAGDTIGPSLKYGDMTFDGNGRLHWYASINGSGASYLYAVDPTTRRAKNTGLVGPNGATGAAFNAAGLLVTTSNSGADVYTVDLASSVLSGTLIGTASPSVYDMGSCATPNLNPNISVVKSVANITRSQNPATLAFAGDTLEYTITVTNSGNFPTTDATLVDSIPIGTTYVGSTTTLNGTAVTDISGAMPYVTAKEINTVAQPSGVITVGASTAAVVKFRVTLNASGLPANIVNQATATYPTVGGGTSTTQTTNSNPVSTPTSDFGDAPSSYGNANHRLFTTPLVYLGAVSPDAETASGSSGTGDDTTGTDDEESVTTFPTLTAAASSYTLSVTVFNNSGGSANLVGWLDADLSGTFDSDEATTIAVSSSASAQTVSLTWSSLPGITVGTSYVRLRFTSDSSIATGTASTSLPTGLASNGEVEDYQLLIVENAVLGVAKALDRIIHSNNATDNLYTLVYRLTLENFGSVTLSNLEITDDVVTLFNGLSPTNFNTWVATPANAALLSPAPTLTLNGSWNGTASSNILSASQTLTAGQSKLIYISFDVTVNPAAASPNNTLRDNSATTRGTTPSSTIITDTSTNGTDPDGTDNDNNPDENTVTPTPFLKLVKEVRNCGSSLASCTGTFAVSATAKPGEYLEYRVRYYNISSQAITQLRVNDSLAATTPFQEDTYAVVSPNIADFSVTCPNSSTVDLDRSNAAVTTTPAAGAITAFNINIMAATACNLTQVTPAQQVQVLFKVRIP